MFQILSARALPIENSQAPARLMKHANLLGAIQLSEIALARLINLYVELSALDMALDEKLAPRLDRFSADHRSRIRAPLRQYGAPRLRRRRHCVVAWAAFASANKDAAVPAASATCTAEAGACVILWR